MSFYFLVVNTKKQSPIWLLLLRLVVWLAQQHLHKLEEKERESEEFHVRTPCHDQGPESAISAVVWVVREEKLKNQKEIPKLFSKCMIMNSPGSGLAPLSLFMWQYFFFSSSSYKHSIALIYRSYTLNSWALLPSLLCCSFMYFVLIWCFVVFFRVPLGWCHIIVMCAKTLGEKRLL